jgi:hypothetical protein
LTFGDKTMNIKRLYYSEWQKYISEQSIVPLTIILGIVCFIPSGIFRGYLVFFLLCAFGLHLCNSPTRLDRRTLPKKKLNYTDKIIDYVIIPFPYKATLWLGLGISIYDVLISDASFVIPQILKLLKDII